MSPKKGQSTSSKTSQGFSEEERTAIKERAQELKAEARRGKGAKSADGESDVLAKIAALVKKAVS